MHSRVGTSGALWQYLFSSDSSNGCSERALHGRGLGLNLPAGEFRSVVRENQFEIALQAIFRVLYPVRIIECISGEASTVSCGNYNWIAFPVRYTSPFPPNSGRGPADL